jgi:modulator of FtsH protease HflK
MRLPLRFSRPRFSAINHPADLPPENPWGQAPTDGENAGARWNNPGRRQRPSSGDGPGKGGKSPPPFPPVFNKMPSFFSDRPVRQLALLGTAAIVGLWLLSGLYRVLPEQNGVVLRFGQYTGTVTQSGLHYRWPWPFERVIKENVTFERRIEVGYSSGIYQGMAHQDAPEESMMLTGDANIVDLDFVVQWKIADAKQYLFNIRYPDDTLKRVAESAMREVIGQNVLQDIITDRREDISARVKTIMQDIMNSYGAGIMITQVLIQDASVPAPVLDAFEDVIRATQQAETMRNQALRYRNEIVPQAQGEAIRLVKEAEGYKEQIVSQAKGDAERFTDIYDAYAQAKDVTRQRLYIDAWENILLQNNAVILDGDVKSGAFPLLNLNDLRRAPSGNGASSQETMR